MKVSARTHIYLTIILGLIVLFTSSILTYIGILDTGKFIDMVQTRNENSRLMERVASDASLAESLIYRNQVFKTKENSAKFYEVSTRVYNNLEQLTKENNLKDTQYKIAKELRSNIQLYFGLLDQLNNFPEGKLEQDLDMQESLKKSRFARENLFQEFKREERQDLAVRSKELNYIAGYTPYIILICNLLIIGIVFYYVRKTVAEIESNQRLSEELEANKQQINKRINKTKEIAIQISKGNYDLHFETESQDDLDTLTESMNIMARSLKDSFRTLKDKEWLQRGVAGLNNKLVGDRDVFALSDDIIGYMVNYTQSLVGAIYMIKVEDNLLHLKGNFGLEKNSLPDNISIGHGFAGECVKTLKRIVVNDLQDDLIYAETSIGKIKPSQLLVMPIIRNKKAIGVIELGTVNKYTSRDLDFFELVNSNIGIALLGAQNRRKLQDLLEETQVQTEELQFQRHELEMLNTELERQTQKLKDSEEELRNQHQELLEINQELEERSSLLEEKNELIEERNIEIQTKAEALEQITTYKSEFLANMSHELRTPLNSILLLSKLIAENEHLEQEMTAYAKVINKSGKDLLTLIDDILDLSKVEAGKMSLEVENCYLDDLVQSIDPLFRPLFKEKGLDFNIELHPALPSKIETDRRRLEQILKNLLSNALKFTAKGGIILLVEPAEDKKFIVFRVSDSGIGIAEDKQQVIFDAFQQADGSTNRRFGGTGLGLSISKEFARLLGGSIHLVSEENVGSTFSLSIPLVLQQSAEPVLPISAPIAQLPLHKDKYTVERIPEDIEDDRENILPTDHVILIIEDDTVFAKILMEFTRERNYKVIVAVRGDQGVALAQKYRPLAVFVDIQLPVMDGWEVMRALKNHKQTQLIPVHIMSSLKTQNEELLQGAMDFIKKPVVMEQMQEVFKKLEDALSSTSGKLIIVEENAPHAEALAYYLSNYQIQSEVVSNIIDCIEALKRTDSYCVILDTGISNTETLNLLKNLKKIEQFSRVPVIVFTDHNLSTKEEKKIKSYSNSILSKTSHSYHRILDEVALFLHLIEGPQVPGGKPALSQKFGNLENVLQGKNVLIADDDIRNIFALTKVLEQNQMIVYAATDGKEALKLLEKHAIDVVLMDMMMPELDGFDTMRNIRKAQQYAALPIIALTAKTMQGDRELCIEAGASDYITKPLDVDQLVSLLRVWLYDSVRKRV